MEATLCHPGAGCPKVITTKDRVEIGEKGNLVKLKPNEWNTLVEKIRQGELNKIYCK